MKQSIDEGSVDFTLLAQARHAANQQNLAILGGEIAADSVRTWLAGWGLHTLPWRFWETASELQLDEASLPPDNEYLERGRLFGPGGDLTLRREGEQFRWWFIGEPTTKRPEQLKAADFWATDPTAKLYKVTQRALLWGAWDAKLNRWYDDRVGFARLNYPPSLQGSERVYAHYREYLNAGQVAFVWMYNLDGKGE